MDQPADRLLLGGRLGQAEEAVVLQPPPDPLQRVRAGHQPLPVRRRPLDHADEVLQQRPAQQPHRPDVRGGGAGEQARQGDQLLGGAVSGRLQGAPLRQLGQQAQLLRFTVEVKVGQIIIAGVSGSGGAPQ